MNKISLLWELREARMHLDSFIKEMETEAPADDLDCQIAVKIEHILNHIVLAWHYRNLSVEKVHSLSQEQFEGYARSIPNFGFNLKLLEGWDIKIE